MKLTLFTVILICWASTILSQPVEIAYDTVVNAEISAITEVDKYIFTGSGGDIITIRVQTSNTSGSYKRVQILTPTDSIIASKDGNYANMISFIDFKLPHTGQYIITVAPRDGNITFTYWLSLVCRQQQLSNQKPIAYDTVVNDAIDRIIDMDVFRFDGDTGDIITLRIQTSNTSGSYKRVQILTPTDSVIASKDGNYANMISFIDFKLPYTGQYIITVAPRDGNITFTYWLSLQPVALQHDACVSGILSPDSIIPPNVPITPSVIVWNNGKSLENAIPVYARIGTLYYDTATTITLQPYEKDTVQFKQWMPPPAGIFTIVCTTALELDSYIKNNSLSKTFNVNNSAPEFTSTPVTTAKEGLVYTYNITTSDADAGASLTIVSSTLPPWLTLTDNGDGTALLTGTPSSANVGANEVVLAVTDGFITTPVNQEFSITVSANAVPAFTSTPITEAKVNKMYTYNIAASDADANASLTIASTSIPSWLTLTDNGDGTAVLSGVPDTADVGDHMVVLTATDGIITQPVEHSFTIKVDFETAVAQGENKNNNKPAAATFNAAPNPVDKNSELITFSFNGSNINEAQLTVYDAVGNVVYETEFSLENNGMAQWDLRNRSGNKVANGTYLAMLWLIYNDGTIENLKTSIGVKGY